MFWKNTCLILAVALSGVHVFAGNFAGEFQKAYKLSKQGKYEEARNAYLALLETKQRGKSESKKNEIYNELAICYFKQKDLEKSNEYLEKIQDEYLKKQCQIKILYYQRKKKEIIELLKGEDLASWPDRYIYTAAVNRGACLIPTDREAAEKDLLLAVKYTVNPRQLGRAYLQLGELYEKYVKDKNKAIEYYEKAIADNRSTKVMQKIIMKKIATLKDKEVSRE